MRARGLKLTSSCPDLPNAASRSMRARGLKLKLPIHLWLTVVALHASAWIETNIPVEVNDFLWVALHASAWIETSSGNVIGQLSLVALHASAWIETYEDGINRQWLRGRAPCERVD